MLEKIKLALRLKNNLFDDELNIYIKACKNDLELAGLNQNKISNTDESIVNVVICYCKWQLDYQSQGDRWRKNYNDIKASLALNTKYV